MPTLRTRWPWLLPLLAAACGPAPTARPFLWRIDVDPPSFLYGTIHVSDARVRALPASVAAAIDSCDALYTELRFDDATQAAAAAGMRLPPGETLAGVLPPPLYARLSHHVKSLGGDPRMLEGLRIWAAAVTLTALSDPEISTGEALDRLIVARAEAAKKRVLGLETVAEQLDAFGAFSRDEQAALLVATLDVFEQSQRSGRRLLRELIDIYLRGDEADLLRAMDELSGLTDPALHAKFDRVLLHERNRRMAERIRARLRDEPGRGHLFAVGAAHCPGPGGVVELLRAAGLPVRRL
jgi:hypothetical protein